MHAVSLFSDPRAWLQPGSQAPVWTLAEAAESLPGVLQRELEIVVTGYRLALSVLTGPAITTTKQHRVDRIENTKHRTENRVTQQTLFFHI